MTRVAASALDCFSEEKKVALASGAYLGALRGCELLAIVGKGDKPRNILIPADLAAALRELRGDASGSARVFPISERRINYIVKATADAFAQDRAAIIADIRASAREPKAPEQAPPRANPGSVHVP